jgi:hypothetical protein
VALAPPFFGPSTTFFTGGTPTSSAPSETGRVLDCVPDTVTLDGFTFPVDLTGWSSGALDTFRDAVVTSEQPNDSLFNAKGAWARYSFTWHHGAGQSLRDLDDTADPFRFRSSYGRDWATKYQAGMVHSTALGRSVASATPVLCRSDIYLFLSDGATLYRTSDLTTWTAMTAPGGTVQAMTTDGTDLYVATSTGVVKYLGSATTPTAFATPVVIGTDSIAFCSGRMLVGQANVLKELAAAGTYVSTIKTHFQAAFRWTTLFNIGSRIYVGGFAGSRSELHSLTSDSGGTLVQSAEAAPLPAGEKLRTAVSFSGEAVLCTSSGVRFAQVSGDGALTYGPLITDPGDVQCAFSDGRLVYTGWSSMDAGVRSGVAKYVIDEEVLPLQPAYGADVFESSAIGAVVGVARLLGRTVFAVASSGAWVESATAFVTQSLGRSGAITFGTVEPKALISLRATFLPLNAGESVSVQVFDELGTLIGDGIGSTVGQTVLQVELNGQQVVSAEVDITLLGTGANMVLKQWRIRAYPVPPAVLQWTLPLICKESVIIGINEGFAYSLNMDEVNVWIEDLYASRRLCVLRVGGREYDVRIDQFQWKMDSWTQDGDGPQGTLVVLCYAAA